jgi:signal transduction histidine kinase
LPVSTPAISQTSPAYVLFSVTDQGRGIPADKLEVIFEQFQQVDLSDAHKKGGTGLGLAICKKIVQQHGGQIWVESILGEGSRFYFALPLSKPLSKE